MEKNSFYSLKRFFKGMIQCQNLIQDWVSAIRYQKQEGDWNYACHDTVWCTYQYFSFSLITNKDFRNILLRNFFQLIKNFTKGVDKRTNKTWKKVCDQSENIFGSYCFNSMSKKILKYSHQEEFFCQSKCTTQIYLYHLFS